MKKVLYILLFLPFLTTAQTVVVKDTTWQTAANGKFYEDRLVQYSNGESSQTRRLIGDTASVFASYLARFEAESNRMANIAFEVRDNDKTIRGILQMRDTLLAKFNRDATDTLAAKYAGPLLVKGWTITEDTATLATDFSINGQGQLRYQIAGFPVRNGFLIGRVMRLQNYKATGRALDLYAAPGGNWFSIDDRVRLRLPGNQGLNRAARRLEWPDVLEADVKPVEKKRKKKKG